MYYLYGQNTTIYSHRIVHWLYNYMFRPCILAIVRLYCNLNKQLYSYINVRRNLVPPRVTYTHMV